MEEFALIKSRVNLNRVNLGIALISDLKVSVYISYSIQTCAPLIFVHLSCTEITRRKM